MITQKLKDAMIYLYGRWQDESQYEDFHEYISYIKKRLPKGATKMTFTKRPFEMKFWVGTKKFGVRVMATRIMFGQLNRQRRGRSRSR